MSILLTGFEPWGSETSNPSAHVALALGGHVLPVDWTRATRRLKTLLRLERPKAVVLLGLGTGRRRIELEAVALNVDHCEDAPWTRWRRPIGKGKGLARASRLPLDRLLKVLRAEKIPAGISHHAGTFLCNHVFYVALEATRVPCGFIHLPPESAVPLDVQIAAVRKVVEVLSPRS
jgi:pyroglutamyl-peptidase